MVKTGRKEAVVHQILNGNLLDNTEKENGKTYEINAIASRERGFYIIARSNHSDQIQGITNILLLIALVIPGSVYWYDCRILYNEQKTFCTAAHDDPEYPEQQRNASTDGVPG